MKKKTIFGEERFIPEDMLSILSREINSKTNEMVFDKMEQTLDFQFNKEKLRNWVLFCLKLENIDNSDLVDLATKKKFADKDYQIAVLERALELAVKDKLFYEKELLRIIIRAKIGTYEENLEIPGLGTEIYYKEQAEKKLEEE